MDQTHKHQAHRVEKQITVGHVEQNNPGVRKATQFIWLLFGLLEGILLFRVLLELISANQQNPFARLVNAITAPFLWPFSGLTGIPDIAGVTIDIPALIAMLVYAFLGWVTVRLIWILFYRNPSRTRKVNQQIEIE